MANVIVSIVNKGVKDPREWIIKESTVKARCPYLGDVLDAIPAPDDGSPKRVDVNFLSGPTSMLLDQLKARGHSKFFKINYDKNMRMDHLCMLYGVVEILQIRPSQIDLRKHIRGWISHTKLEPDEIITLHLVFANTKNEKLDGEKLSMWEVLIHQTAYMIDKGEYTAEEAGKLQDVLKQQQPALADAIDKKMKSLQHRQQIHDDARAREVQQAETARINKRVREHKAEKREQQQAELRGERELSEGIAKHVLTRRPEMQITIQQGKHGKRNPPGSRKRRGKDDANGRGEEEG